MSDNKIDDLKLKEDVKQLFENKSNKIQYVNDVFEVEQKLNLEVVVNENDIYQKLYESKKIAQITLNLYNEIVIYKDLKVLTRSDFKNLRKQKSSKDLCSDGQPEESEGTEESSGSVEEQKESESEIRKSCDEETIDYLCSGEKPDKAEVIERLYRYILYFLTAKYSEIFEIFKNIFGSDHLENLKCSICENNISFNDCKCSVCEESLFAFYEREVDKHEKSKISEIKNRKSCEMESSVIGDGTNGDDKNKGEFDGELVSKHDADLLDCNKWKCKHCEFVNDDGNLNCVACMEARADWICKQCNVVNELSAEQCKFCGGSRENTSNNTANREKDGTNEGWTCWFGKCSRRNGGNEQFCTDCGIDKSASRERGAAVDMRKYGRTQQVWICHACGRINDDLTRSLCYRCREPKVDDKEGKMGIPSDNGANKWECDKCKSGNAREVLSCTNCHSPRMWSCKHCTMRNQISDDHCDACGEINENRIIKYCLECKNCEIICDNLCDDCLKARNENWTCLFRKCSRRNGGNEQFCTDCGIDKSASRERGAAVDMRKYGRTQQVWICHGCDHINDDLTRSLCCKCYESKFNVKGGHKEGKKVDKMVDDFVDIPSDREGRMGIPSDKEGKMGIPSDKEGKMGIPSDNGADKWECDKCKSGNAREVLSCKNCQSPRMWSCKHCTMLNRISDDRCDTCGKINENRIIKYCLQCKTREIICDNLCDDCWKAQNERWTCWYRFCSNKNPGNVKYCKHCGLDRYADKIKIGAPMMRCTGDVPVEIWICDRCYLINDISNDRCGYICTGYLSNYPCYGSNKYRKRCHKCDYKYNYDYSSYCEMCKEWLY